MQRRVGHLMIVASLLVACQSPATPPRPSPTVPTESISAPNLEALRLTTARSAHTATTLEDGRVLITGGFAGAEAGLSSTELFDPTSGAFVAGADLQQARLTHTATRLNDGRVLIVGGLDNGRYLDSAEVFDPTTGSLTATGPLRTGRAGHGAVLLADGRVLIVGGVGAGWAFLASAEIYDPETGVFESTGSMHMARESHTVTALGDGRVLVTGGHTGQRRALEILASAEIYDPRTGVFASVGALETARHKHDALLLADGRVLILGGADGRDSEGQLSSVEIFDPKSGVFVTAASMALARYKIQGTSQRLADGRVVVPGGPGRVEVFDPETGGFVLTPFDLGPTRLFAATASLSDGRILVTGGYGDGIVASDSAWLIDLANR